MTTAALLAEIDGFKELAVEVVERLALILAELRKRQQPHPFFQDRILRFWRSIADRTLSAEAAILLANQDMISAVLPLSRQMQVDVAKGQEIAVADPKGDGSYVQNVTTIHRMDRQTMKRVFSNTGIRSVSQQAEIIAEEGRFKKVGPLTVLKSEGLLKVGNQKLTMEQIAVAAREIGWECKWVGGRADIANVALIGNRGPEINSVMRKDL